MMTACPLAGASVRFVGADGVDAGTTVGISAVTTAASPAPEGAFKATTRKV